MIKDLIHAGSQANIAAASSYLRPAGRPNYGSTLGTPVLRDGSIVGLTCTADITSFVSSGTLSIEARINDTIVFSVTSSTITANGVVSWGGIQSAGIDSFSATTPDVIQLSMTRNSGSFSYRPIATCKFIETDADESHRHLLVASTDATISGVTPVYLRAAGRSIYTSTMGTRMLDSGSIVGIGFHGSCSAFLSSDVVRAQMRVNNVVVLETSNVTVTGLGPFTPTFSTQASGIDRFSVGDLLQVTVVGAVGLTIINPIVVVELQLDLDFATEQSALAIATTEQSASATATTEQSAGSVATTEQSGSATATTEQTGGAISGVEI